jgi:hypothetical protein
MAKLIAQSPELAGQVYELDSAVLTFGRAEDNVLCIPHGSVSSHHGEFRLDGGDYRLVDMDSTNGSKVNDEPVTDRLLSNGDLVMLGNMLFIYESSVPAGAAPAAPLPAAGDRIELGGARDGVGRPASFVNLAAVAKPDNSGGAKLPAAVILGILIALAGAGYLVYRTML